jgi:hypothetical protein
MSYRLKLLVCLAIAFASCTNKNDLGSPIDEKGIPTEFSDAQKTASKQFVKEQLAEVVNTRDPLFFYEYKYLDSAGMIAFKDVSLYDYWSSHKVDFLKVFVRPSFDGGMEIIKYETVSDRDYHFPLYCDFNISNSYENSLGVIAFSQIYNWRHPDEIWEGYSERAAPLRFLSDDKSEALYRVIAKRGEGSPPEFYRVVLKMLIKTPMKRSYDYLELEKISQTEYWKLDPDFESSAGYKVFLSNLEPAFNFKVDSPVDSSVVKFIQNTPIILITNRDQKVIYQGHLINGGLDVHLDDVEPFQWITVQFPELDTLPSVADRWPAGEETVLHFPSRSIYYDGSDVLIKFGVGGYGFSGVVEATLYNPGPITDSARELIRIRQDYAASWVNFVDLHTQYTTEREKLERVWKSDTPFDVWDEIKNKNADMILNFSKSNGILGASAILHKYHSYELNDYRSVLNQIGVAFLDHPDYRRLEERISSLE